MSVSAKKFYATCSHNPPIIVLEYEKAGKLRRRKMPVRDLSSKSRSQEILQQLTKRHPEFLNARLMNLDQLRNLLQKMIDKLSSADSKQKTGLSPNNSSSLTGSSSKKFSPVVDGEKDLNKLDQEEINSIKKKMSVSFEANRKKPGDAGFEYDKRVDFSKKPKTSSGWDDDNEEIEEDDFDI